MTVRRFDLDRWMATRTWDARRDLRSDEVVAARGELTVAVLVPARDEEATIGPLVESLLADAVSAALVDDLVVVDSGSRDRTAEVASAAGARVLSVGDGGSAWPLSGKGGAVWRGLAGTASDLVLLLDADVAPFRPDVVCALLGPLVLHGDVQLVKAAADRPLVVDGVSHPGAGGRVTELVARPLLNALWPELAGMVQPLSGELAARRSVLEQISLVTGYGLEIAMLLDVYRLVGADGLGQVVLGERVHRHQSDAALGRMASEVLRAALSRAGQAPLADVLVQFARDDDRLVWDGHRVELRELPPVHTVRQEA